MVLIVCNIFKQIYTHFFKKMTKYSRSTILQLEYRYVRYLMINQRTYEIRFNCACAKYIRYFFFRDFEAVKINSHISRKRKMILAMNWSKFLLPTKCSFLIWYFPPISICINRHLTKELVFNECQPGNFERILRFW